MSEAREHRVGRVVCVSGAEVVMVIEAATTQRPQPRPMPGPALQKGSLVKMAVGGSTLFGIVRGLSISGAGRGG